jgi:hypothetical protein
VLLLLLLFLLLLHDCIKQQTSMQGRRAHITAIVLPAHLQQRLRSLLLLLLLLLLCFACSGTHRHEVKPIFTCSSAAAAPSPSAAAAAGGGSTRLSAEMGCRHSNHKPCVHCLTWASAAASLSKSTDVAAVPAALCMCRQTHKQAHAMSLPAHLQQRLHLMLLLVVGLPGCQLRWAAGTAGRRACHAQ